MRTTWGDHDRFVQTYFSTFKGLYFSGDGCRVDEDGDYWLLGRVDDVINVSGHRLGTAEVESALVSHPAVAEAAVVGCPHDIKGQGIYAYVTLKVGHEPTDELLKELIKHVRKEIGPIATPDVIQWAPGLPKTRSGKIMRRILRKIAENETDTGGRHQHAGRSLGGRRPDPESARSGSRDCVSPGYGGAVTFDCTLVGGRRSAASRHDASRFWPTDRPSARTCGRLRSLAARSRGLRSLRPIRTGRLPHRGSLDSAQRAMW